MMPMPTPVLAIEFIDWSSVISFILDWVVAVIGWAASLSDPIIERLLGLLPDESTESISPLVEWLGVADHFFPVFYTLRLFQAAMTFMLALWVFRVITRWLMSD